MDYADALKIAAMLKATWVSDEDGISHYSTRVRNRGSIAPDIAAGRVPRIVLEVWTLCGREFTTAVQGPGTSRCSDCLASSGERPELQEPSQAKALPPLWSYEVRTVNASCRTVGHRPKLLYSDQEVDVWWCDQHEDKRYVWTEPERGPFTITREQNGTSTINWV